VAAGRLPARPVVLDAAATWQVPVLGVRDGQHLVRLVARRTERLVRTVLLETYNTHQYVTLSLVSTCIYGIDV